MQFDVIMQRRDVLSHKGNFGRVLVVAGSLGMAGAAIMCGKAALRSGAGLVTFAVTEELFSILQVAVPEAICKKRDFQNEIDIHGYNVIALGSGLGISKDNISIIKKILNEYRGKLVIDADGLNCIMKYKLYPNLANTNAQCILTPHLGEACRLLEVDKITDPLNAGREISETFSTTVVMKGHNTYVIDEKNFYKNFTGNPGMATAGSGDVLTGTIAALLAQGYSVFESGKIGVYVHGLAGDICAKEKGEVGIIATDIIEKLPLAINSIYGDNN